MLMFSLGCIIAGSLLVGLWIYNNIDQLKRN